METRNLELYGEIRRIRQESKLSLYDSTRAIPHPLVGRQLLRVSDGRTYKIEKAVKHWYWGWYIAFLLERDGSHHLVRYENLSADDPHIIDTINRHRTEYQLVEAKAA